MKNFMMTFGLLLFHFAVSAQSLPVKQWAGSGNTPLIFYITGDGGMNEFSTSLCSGLKNKGYDVSALNARSYFWEKKTASGAANDISQYLNKMFAARTDQQLIIVGYSFGADVLPFIVNELPGSLKQKLVKTVMIAPSASTDLEVHLGDMMGIEKKRSLNVVDGVNSMHNVKLTTVGSATGDLFPYDNITLTTHKHFVLDGGHHFEGDPLALLPFIVN